MSNYQEELCARHKDIGNIKELTKQIKADLDLSKCLKHQNDKEKREKIKREIQNLLKR